MLLELLTAQVPHDVAQTLIQVLALTVGTAEFPRVRSAPTSTLWAALAATLCLQGGS